MLNYASISGQIGNAMPITGDIAPPNISGTLEITEVYEKPYPFYTDEITVTPRADEQVLKTAYKSLLDDITVLSIPYTEVSNLSGGVTVNIG